MSIFKFATATALKQGPQSATSKQEGSDNAKSVSNIANFDGDTKVIINAEGDQVDMSIDTSISTVRIFADKDQDVTKRMQNALNDGFRISPFSKVIQAIVNTVLSLVSLLRGITGTQTLEYNAYVNGSIIKVIVPVSPGQPLSSKDVCILIKEKQTITDLEEHRDNSLNNKVPAVPKVQRNRGGKAKPEVTKAATE